MNHVSNKHHVNNEHGHVKKCRQDLEKGNQWKDKTEQQKGSEKSCRSF